MFKIHKKEIEWGGRKLTLETGKIARQADGAVVATYGETTVIATVVADNEPRVGLDFFPLTVNYQEKYYAAGKIPGGFLKRESRPSDDEVLISRLIDRPIRPLFVKGFKCETQVINTVLSYDMENDPDIVAMIATSAALTISGIPFLGPIAAARVGYKDGEYILNTHIDEKADSDLDMVVAGTADAVLMVESEASELSEEVMLGAVLFAQEGFRPVIDAIIDLAEDCAKQPRQLIEVDSSDLAEKVKSLCEDNLRDAYEEADKMKRHDKISEIKGKVKDELINDDSNADHLVLVSELFKNVEKSIVRGNILNTKQRIDGRDLTTVRPINIEVGILPRSHGSALFTRGETQALVVTTLGTGEDEKLVETLHSVYKQNFMLHYNFPPFSVGETGRVGAPGRREIGHGKLAWRSLGAVLPNSDEFPYTTRIVSEITESNGSSSTATVCGASLSMMDAGIPISAPVAGVAMGLIKEEDDYVVLTDILGDEDHLGDMDFKVAGTENGITALQMDIKITGINRDIMKVALEQAHDGRMHILNEMNKVIGTARPELDEYAPKIKQITIPADKIRDIIGAGGKVIRALVEETGAKIDVNDEGQVKIASNSEESIKMALKRIEDITAVPEIGKIYHGKVAKIMDFGAFVSYIGNNDGLVHISQLNNERVDNVENVVKEGQMVYVKLLSIDDRGKVRLSMKVVNQETGEDISDQFPPDVPPSSKPRRHNRR